MSLVCVKGRGRMYDVHLRSLPKLEEEPQNNWHTTQYDNQGLCVKSQAGTERQRRREREDKLGRNKSSCKCKHLNV